MKTSPAPRTETRVQSGPDLMRLDSLFNFISEFSVISESSEAQHIGFLLISSQTPPYPTRRTLGSSPDQVGLCQGHCCHPPATEFTPAAGLSDLHRVSNIEPLPVPFSRQPPGSVRC